MTHICGTKGRWVNSFVPGGHIWHHITSSTFRDRTKTLYSFISIYHKWIRVIFTRNTEYIIINQCFFFSLKIAFKVIVTSVRDQWVNGCVSGMHLWFRQWLVIVIVSSHYINQCLPVQQDFIQNTYIFLKICICLPQVSMLLWASVS